MIDTLFNKLSYKEGQTIFVLKHPREFNELLATVPQNIPVKKDIGEYDMVSFVIAFATNRNELEALAQKVFPHLNEDAIVWMAYPQSNSEYYTNDFTIDAGWEVWAHYKMLSVRQASINDEWSALCYRKTDYIKKINRQNSLGVK